MTPPKDRDALIAVLEQALESHCDFPRPLARTVLEALESSGCFVGPVVATNAMVEAGWKSDAAGYPEFWTAMQSANPYRKDHPNDR